MQITLQPLPAPPWAVPPAAPTVKSEVTKSETNASLLSAAIKTIADRGHTDLQLFTDGSTVEGTSNGGAGLVVMAGKAIIHRWQAATGVHSSSLQAEKTAMEKAIS